MSRTLKVSIAAVMLVFIAGEASARTVNISGTHSRDAIRKACDAVGGVGSNTLGSSGGYSCDNLDKGTAVVCDAKGHCKGYVPD